MTIPGQSNAGFLEVFIRFHGADIDAMERALMVLQEAGGRAVHVFPPGACIARIPEHALDTIRRAELIEYAEAGEIGSDKTAQETENVAWAIAAWNERLRFKADPARRDQGLDPIPWDHPDRLPPDPPHHIRERLRKREDDMQSDE